MAKASDLGVDSVIDVLTGTFGLTGTIQGDEFRIHCVNPNHPDTDPSTGVNLVSGYWNCFACGFGGDLVELGFRVLKIKRSEVKALLRPSTPEALLTNVQSRLANMFSPETTRTIVKPNTFGPYDPEPLDYMRERGFSDDTLQKWGVRWCNEQVLKGGKNGEFAVKNCIAFPIRDAECRVLAWGYRATPLSPLWQQRNARYVYSNDAPLSQIWYGLDHIGSAKKIAIVEGAFDTQWVDQCGFPVLGLLGSQMAARKMHLLRRFDELTLFADRDNAGAVWVKQVGEELSPFVPIKVVLYDKRLVPPRGKVDPQMLMQLDVEIHMARAIPWTKFRMRVAS